MASTQEMQRRAKERRLANQYIEAMRSQQQIWEAVAQDYDSSGRLSFAVGTSQQLLSWYDSWRRDYIDRDKGSNADNLSKEAADLIAEQGHFRLIILDGEAVGFMMLKNKTHRSLSKEALGIEIMYIEAQYRGRHLATLGYNFAVNALNAKWIELSYDRVKGREAYWASLGFIWIAGSGNLRQNDGTWGSICVLSQLDTRVGVLLHPQNIYETFKKTNDFCLKEALKTQKIVDFA